MLEKNNNMLQLLAQNACIYVSLREIAIGVDFFFDIDSFHNDNRPETNWPSLSCANCMRWDCDSFMSSRPFETKWMT